jgi:5-oxopent-3-ene-1,2,5-tricarboxylate decarboxylase / 2-hydroxyhepta-2,4-diene-1,7-dioate isomerase
MKVAQFESEQGFFVGLEVDGKWINYSKASAIYYALVHDVTLLPRPTIEVLLERGQFDAQEFRTVAAFVRKNALRRYLAPPAEVLLRAPLMRPRKIIALGLNYALHVKEGSLTKPAEPVLFMKAGSSVIDPGEAIRIPRGLGRIDHEVELAVVIGKAASGVKRKNAFGHVAGYTIVNDVTARSLQTEDINRRYPWFRTKSFDTFTPMGPWIVTPDAIRTPVRLDVECRVNGSLRQRSNTRRMLFDIPAIIEYISRTITLEPGDIISTGTPEGIGPIRHGDTVTCRIEGIGELKNPVRNR